MTSLQLNRDPHNAFAHFFGNPDLAPFLYALSRNMAEGHICLDMHNLPTDPEFWEDYGAPMPINPVFPENSDLVAYGVQTDQTIEKPFVRDGNLLYTARFFHYEGAITAYIRQVSATAIEQSEIRSTLDSKRETILENMARGRVDPSDTAEERIDWPTLAAIRACMSRLTIVTGGPGTGKTTTLSKILQLLLWTNPKMRIALAAPTGKAAERMGAVRNFANGLTCSGPTTIHKLLGKPTEQHRDNKFGRHKHLPYDAVIIDESSMVGVSLFTQLIHALQPGAKLILIGDADQLFPVEAGNLFGDLCALFRPLENRFPEEDIPWLNTFLHTESRIPLEAAYAGNAQSSISFIRLHKTHRYDPNADIGRYTAALIRGNAQTWAPPQLSGDGSLQMESGELTNIIKDFSRHYHPYLGASTPEEALKAFSKVRILCATQETRYGVHHINAEVASLLGRHAHAHGLRFKPVSGFYHNMPVMVTRNQRDPVLNNGDVGIIRKADHSNGLLAYFPDNSGNEEPTPGMHTAHKAVHPSQITACEPVFAMTIHKSQGSEFEQVLVVLPPDPAHRILSTELLFTAMTRVKSGGSLVLYATEAVVGALPFRRMLRISGRSRRQINLFEPQK